MTKLDALRRLLSAPRVEADLGRIGHRVIEAKPDGRERLNKPRTVQEWFRQYGKQRAS